MNLFSGLNIEKKSSAAGGKIIGGAALVGGVAAGVLTGSLLLGVAAAGATAYAATRNDKVGDAAKATGKAANAVGAKAAEVNKEHRLTERAVEGLKSGYRGVKQLNAKYDISGKTVTGIKTGMDTISNSLSSKPQAATSAQVSAGSASQTPIVVGLPAGEASQANRNTRNESEAPPPPPPPEGHIGIYPAPTCR